jgi:hypothetical protein
MRYLSYVVSSTLIAVLSGCGSDSGGSSTPAASTTSTTRAVQGQLSGTPSRARAPAGDYTGYQVFIEGASSGELYRQDVAADGSFSVAVPTAEGTVTVSVVAPDGTPLGTIMSGAASGGSAPTGLDLRSSGASLGTLNLAQPLVVGSGATVVADTSLTARVDGSGFPVGLATSGKGGAANGEASPGRISDRDGDGIIDILDADTDGDGLANDLDTGTALNLQLPGFFMNLKVGAERAHVYYQGTPTEIDAALQEDTIITMELRGSNPPTSAKINPVPGPGWLAGAEHQTGSLPLTYGSWSADAYAFDRVGSGSSAYLQAFVKPKALMQAGNLFHVEATSGTGVVKHQFRVVSYVWKNIPRLVSYGPAIDTVTTYTVPTGGPAPALTFADGENLVLTWKVPVDEVGDPIKTGYRLEFFYENASGQVNPQINAAATWTTPVSGFSTGVQFMMDLSEADLEGSWDDVEGTYTATIPSGVFPTVVTLTDGSTTTITGYKIDIAAQKNGNNAAVMLQATKTPTADG